MGNKEHHKDLSFSSFLLGALLGGLAGAAYALLKAPQSGEDTRQQLREVAFDLQTRTDKAMSSIKDHGKSAADKFSWHAKIIKEEAIKAIDEAIDEGKATLEETKTIARESKQRIQEDLKSAENNEAIEQPE
mgnify:CR=1 FL=1